MPRVKKGALCAYHLETLVLTERTETWRPPTVTREAHWALGTVWASTRDGKVREIIPAGLDGTVTANRLKMLAKLQTVRMVLFIPGDQVDGPAMLQAAQHCAWPTLVEVEEFVRSYLLNPSTPRASNPS